MLNALRHQRNWNHPIGSACSWFKSVRVLNALRHQRNWNPTVEFPLTMDNMCSTPYGIKGIGTQTEISLYNQKTSAQRLTASKELEQTLFSAISIWLDVFGCSTPYGIKGIGTAVAGTPSQSGTVEENTSTSWTWTIFPATYC